MEQPWYRITIKTSVEDDAEWRKWRTGRRYPMSHLAFGEHLSSPNGGQAKTDFGAVLELKDRFCMSVVLPQGDVP